MDSSARRSTFLLGSLFLAALAVRVMFALNKGLVLDEFHTLFHASQESVRALLESLRTDNHPPLAILLVRLSRAIFGDSEMALRLPALVCGMTELVLVAWMGLRWVGRGAPWAVALVAASSLHLDFSTQVRMYALLTLAVTGLTRSLLGVLEGGGPRWSLVGWIVLGVHAHYYFLVYAGVLGLVTAALVLREQGGLARLNRQALPVAAGVVLCLPWILWGFVAQVQQGLPPGGDDLGFAGLLEAMVHLVFLNIRLGGDGWREIFIASGGLALLLGAWGFLQMARDRERRAAAILLVTAAFGVPLVAFGVATLRPQMGFTWHYVLPSLAPLALLLGAATDAPRKLPRLAAAVVLASALFLCLLNAVSRGTEDYPGAVRSILDAYEPGDLIVSAEWQPALFPAGMPWDYYAPRLSDDPPQRAEMNGTHLVRPGLLRKARRVHLLASRVPADHDLVRQLNGGFVLLHHGNYGFGREVYLYERQQ